MWEEPARFVIPGVEEVITRDFTTKSGQKERLVETVIVEPNGRQVILNEYVTPVPEQNTNGYKAIQTAQHKDSIKTVALDNIIFTDVDASASAPQSASTQQPGHVYGYDNFGSEVDSN